MSTLREIRKGLEKGIMSVVGVVMAKNAFKPPEPMGIPEIRVDDVLPKIDWSALESPVVGLTDAIEESNRINRELLGLVRNGKGLVEGKPELISADNPPRVPKRPADLRRWKAVWMKIKPLAARGASYVAMQTHIRDAEVPDCSLETITDIVRAGEAGLLD